MKNCSCFGAELIIMATAKKLNEIDSIDYYDLLVHNKWNLVIRSKRFFVCNRANTIYFPFAADDISQPSFALAGEDGDEIGPGQNAVVAV